MGRRPRRQRLLDARRDPHDAGLPRQLRTWAERKHARGVQNAPRLPASTHPFWTLQNLLEAI